MLNCSYLSEYKFEIRRLPNSVMCIFKNKMHSKFKFMDPSEKQGVMQPFKKNMESWRHGFLDCKKKKATTCFAPNILC